MINKLYRLLYKLLCPYWKRHVKTTWEMGRFSDTYFWCKKCPVLRFNGVGNAYRRTLKHYEILFRKFI